jgi:chemotaxis family two-component system sensor kinase Cph1
VSTTPVDLDNCAQEPIRIPGSIQPRGYLLAVEESDLTITQASANLADLLGTAGTNAAGKPLARVLGTAAASIIERATAVFGDLGERNPHDVVLDVGGRAVQFDAILHRAADGLLLVELEPAEGPRPFSFPNTYLAVRGAVADLNRSASLVELYDITAQAVKKLTGFDRVMVYRYDHEFNGEVVAEVKRDDLEPFLGLHFPASDIPAQARALYEQNWIRLISDVDYLPVPLVPVLDPRTEQPLDLSVSTLRSVSPIHIEYLHNMGVRASMSISLLRHGTLWGLIACHHYAGPHTPPYGVRAAAEFLGSTLSLRLVDRAEETELHARIEGQATLEKLTAAIRNEQEATVVALLGAPSVFDLVPADGVVISAEGFLTTQGTVPNPATVQAIADWARSTGQDLVATDSLTASVPELDVPPPVASGVLAMTLPEQQYLLWFRTEALQEVDWSGDPRSKATAGSDGRLSPRKSFDRWREVVRLRSLPWSEAELGIASELRRHTVEALYARSQQDLRLAEALQRSLLPATLPTVRYWEISAFYEPAEGKQIGGDWYDAFVLSDGTLAVMLGDVAGHGLAAAGVMAQLRNVLRGHLIDTNSPEESLNRLNEFASLLLPDAFATAVVACIDTTSGQVRASCAGHLPPYLIGTGSVAKPAPLDPSPPLGIAGMTYPTSDFTLDPGDGIVLYSDGLVERRDEVIDLSIDRFGAALSQLVAQPSATVISTARDQLQNFDDATILAVHRMPGPPR